jgi:anti-sigma factor RsiW
MSAFDEISDSDPIDEELVAYLDDELSSSDRARVERRLAEEEVYRERLRSLQAAWDALDLLPKTVASHGLTATVVSTVVAQEQQMATQAMQRIDAQRNRRWLGLTLASSIAAVIGFVVVYRSETSDNRALVRDLPVIEKVDQLRNTPSVDFLEQLREEGLFLADANDS